MRYLDPVCVVRVNKYEDALDLVNQHIYGTGQVFTRLMERFLGISQQIVKLEWLVLMYLSRSNGFS